MSKMLLIGGKDTNGNAKMLGLTDEGELKIKGIEFTVSPELMNLVLKKDHQFADEAERDSYFDSNPNEKVKGVFVNVGEGFQVWQGEQWQDVTAVVRGPEGQVSQEDFNEHLADVAKLDFGVNNAGFRNSIFRGKFLGNEVTAAQWAAIEGGTFEDMYVGDYWTIGGINYRIAAFNYYYNTGDTACTENHITVVPDTCFYTHAMNSSNTTEGGYVGSLMYEEGLEQVKSTIKAAFPGRVMKHRKYLCNAVDNGQASAAAWFDSEVELMNEHMVYGSNATAFGKPTDGHRYNVGIEKSQLPLFRFRHDLIRARANWWFRDVASAARFAGVNSEGLAFHLGASGSNGVRPAFSIS